MLFILILGRKVKRVQKRKEERKKTKNWWVGWWTSKQWNGGTNGIFWFWILKKIMNVNHNLFKLLYKQ